MSLTIIFKSNRSLSSKWEIVNNKDLHLKLFKLDFPIHVSLNYWGIKHICSHFHSGDGADEVV